MVVLASCIRVFHHLVTDRCSCSLVREHGLCDTDSLEVFVTCFMTCVWSILIHVPYLYEKKVQSLFFSLPAKVKIVLFYVDGVFLLFIDFCVCSEASLSIPARLPSTWYRCTGDTSVFLWGPAVDIVHRSPGRSPTHKKPWLQRCLVEGHGLPLVPAAATPLLWSGPHTWRAYQHLWRER